MQMGFNSRVFVLILHIFFCYPPFIISSSDIHCLTSIKDSLEDPHNRLKWNFDHTGSSICDFSGVTCSSNDEGVTVIINLELRDMGLNGRFPRGVESCKGLQNINFSGNNLFGPIPLETFEKLPNLVTLDLSNNRFAGEIPLSIAYCPLLDQLLLDNNQLTGQIPRQLGNLQWIKRFNVSNNMLSGPVPTFLYVSFMQESYANNDGLCGGPLKPCKGHQWIYEYSFRIGFIVGYGFSAVSVITVFMFYRRPWVSVKKAMKMIKRKMIILIVGSNQLRPQRRQNERKEPDHQMIIKSLTVKRIQARRNEISVLAKPVPRMRLEDIRDATKKFSQDNVLGLGKIGTMYKAAFSNGRFLAVKKLQDSPNLEKQVMLELKTLVRLKHGNIVQLIGFCVESNERLLAYEYLPNGNLYDWLHPNEGEASNMEWPLRVKIASGVARGLIWLHHKMKMAHLHISSKCILLDQNFEPKLSNFSQSLQLNSSGRYKSEIGDKDLFQSRFVKKDVRGFGLVLLELITGTERSKIEISLKSYYRMAPNERIAQVSPPSSSMFHDAIDKSLLGQGYDNEIFQLLEVSCQCVHGVPYQRPTMLQVYKTLGGIGERYGLVDVSEVMMLEEIAAAASTKNKRTEVEITEAL